MQHTHIALPTVNVNTSSSAVFDAISAWICNGAAPVARVTSALFDVLCLRQAARWVGHRGCQHDARH
jgi:hypothetical protein